ncbi:SDR family NAD(P)-dependent oxidoreductase [candidate division CSSED10-310 bacterium]|uniref:SDR family NAD(P)-dependent oxidoreductase n=1 Tax=candidate division CSSED10-310 bacterium TaxID=2855610 RepID=A0ABV6Z5J6_UNCC1
MSDDRKVAIVTGASRGLGKALCIQLCQQGYDVAGLARSKQKLAELEAGVSALPGQFSSVSVDVADGPAMAAAVNEVKTHYGSIDLAIANAGISEAGWAAKQSPEKIHRLFQVNFMGMIHLFSPLIPEMIERKRGHLVGIVSIAGYRGMPALSAYAASKAAMRSYLETLRIELKSRGITVSSICPGYFETDMTSDRARPMPFLISVEKAAAHVMKAIDAKASEVVFPFPMALSTRLLNFLPNSIYDIIVKFL